MGNASHTLRGQLYRGALGSFIKIRQLLITNWIFFLGFLLVIGLLAVGSTWSWDYWSELSFDRSHNLTEIKTDRTRIIQQLLLIIGGVAAFALAAWRTWTAHRQAGAALEQVKVALRQADLADRAHSIDRYTRAANMLDSDKIAVRQAAVYTLLELGRTDSRNFYNLAIKLLAGFARVRSAEFMSQQAQREHKRKMTATYVMDKPEFEIDETIEFSDLYDAISSIGWLRNQRPKELEAELTAKFTLDLSGIVAARRSFVEIDFSSANLRGADFTGSFLRLNKFRRADVRYTTFHGIDAYGCDFNEAFFQNTDLELAQFVSCNFENVSFAAAEFNSTNFQRCNISGAQFQGASGLTGAMISDAWAWSDNPPILPKGVSFKSLQKPGAQGELRVFYNKMQLSRRGFDPPTAIRTE